MRLFTSVVLISAAFSVNADSWIYGGVQGGQSNFGEDKSTTFGLHAGTGFLPFIGLEAGYFDHGSIDINGRNRQVTADGSSFYFSAKPSVDIGPFHLYAKAGINSYLVSYTGTNEPVSDDKGAGIMYGLGAEYSVLPGITMGASYQSFGIKLDNEDDRIKSFTLNATFHFL